MGWQFYRQMSGAQAKQLRMMLAWAYTRVQDVRSLALRMFSTLLAWP